MFFGPGVFNLLHLHLFQDGHATSTLLLLAQIGGYVLMFIAGIETDIDRMREASVTAFIVALSGVIWPFLLGAGVGHLFGLSWTTACFLGGALTATSVSISARTLMDAGQMASPEGNRDSGRGGDRRRDGLVRAGASSRLRSRPKAKHSAWRPWRASGFSKDCRAAASHPLIVQMTMISICVAYIFRGRIRRGQALAGPADSSTSKADSQ